MAVYIDPLAYARGAELANQQNWRDALNASTLQARDEALRQSQARFGVSLPYAEAAAVEKYNDLTANKRFASDVTTILANAAKLSPENKDAYLVDSVKKAMASIDPRDPSAGRYLDNFSNWITQNAAAAFKAGNQPLHQALAGLLPNARSSEAAQMKNVAVWSDPASATNPALVRGAGGVIKPNGMIEYNGVSMYPSQFAELQQRKAKDPYTQSTYDMINKLRLESANRDVGAQGASKYSDRGQEVLLNQVTGQLTPMPFRKETAPPQNVNTPQAETFGATPVDWSRAPAQNQVPSLTAPVANPAPPVVPPTGYNPAPNIDVGIHGRGVPLYDLSSGRGDMAGASNIGASELDPSYWYRVMREGATDPNTPTYPEFLGGQ